MSNYLSTTDIRRFKNCRGAWHFSSPLRHNYIPKVEPIYFTRGRAWHAGLATWVQTGFDDNIMLKTILAEIDNEIKIQRNRGGDIDADKVRDLIDTAKELAPIYCDWARRHLVPKLAKVLDIEVKKTVPLTEELDFAFTCDLVIEIKNKLWIVDYKVVNQLPSDQNFLDFDEQITGYLEAVGRYYGRDALGAIFVYIRHKQPAEPKQLATGGLSQDKRQQTTPQKYFARLQELGLPPLDYVDILKLLNSKLETDWFKMFEVVKRRDEKRILWKSHQDLAKEMLNDPLIYFAPERFKCSMCSYKSPCLSQRAGKNFLPVLKAEYIKGEPRYDQEADKD